MESLKGKELDYIHLLYCKCHNINPNRGGSYIDSLDWIKNKKAAINPINKKDIFNTLQQLCQIMKKLEKILKE